MDIDRNLFAVVLINIFFLSMGLAGINFGYASELCAVLLVVSLLLSFKRYAKNLWTFLVQTKSNICIALALYLAIDMVNYFVFGNFFLAWQKYRVAAVLMLLFAALCILRHRSDLSKMVLLTLGFSAAVVSVYTLTHYFLPLNLPLYYTARFAMRRDYNMYATQLVIGMIALTFGALAVKNKKAVLALTVTLPIILSVSMLSGSRRVLIMLPVIVAVLAVVTILASVMQFGRRKAGAVFACFFVVVALTCAETALFKRGLEQINAPGSETRSIETAPAVETQLMERYETIRNSSVFDKRRVIWGLAVQVLSNYSGPELIFGRGGGENILLYDQITTPLDDIYPDRQLRLGALSAHNMFLADWLDGGIIKLIALVYLVAATAISSILIALKRPLIGLPIGMVLAVCMINSLVSNRFGLIYDRYFMIFAALTAIEYQATKEKAYSRRTEGGNGR